MPRTGSQQKPAAAPRTKRWTRKEYYRLFDLGFFEGKRVELIEGEILEMPAMSSPHAVALGLTHEALRMAFGAGYWIRDQAPLHLGPRSEPEPDVAVVAGEPRDYQHHPTSALLVVEISSRTLYYDRGRKARLYAKAGLGDYWIINLLDNQLEVLRDPQPDPQRVGRYAYAAKTVLKTTDFVTPLAVPNARVAIRDLLP